jgi:hypothetical protein
VEPKELVKLVEKELKTAMCMLKTSELKEE